VQSLQVCSYYSTFHENPFQQNVTRKGPAHEHNNNIDLPFLTKRESKLKWTNTELQYKTPENLNGKEIIFAFLIIAIK
jgi:hypothetical protein